MVSEVAPYSKPVQIGRPIRRSRLRKNLVAVFRCQCGKTFVCLIASIRHGATTSCGCYKSKCVSARQTKHGMGGTKEYMCWHNLVARCTDTNNPRYHDWGGRGVSVCDDWMTFEAFFADMGELPFKGAQIDRKDNSKGYSKENCKWSTNKQNNRNTRRTRYVIMGGEKMSLAEAVERLDVRYHWCRHMVNKGVSMDEIAVIASRSDKFKPKQHGCIS